MSWLEFTGRIQAGAPKVAVDVELRGVHIGQLSLDLDQWDDLRSLRDKNDLTWLDVVANDSKAKAILR